MTDDTFRRLSKARAQTQEATRTHQLTPRVTIEEKLVDDLKEHQRKLTDYVKSYLTFRELTGLCEDARDYFEDVDRRTEKQGLPYLRQLRTHFDDIRRKLFVRASIREDLREEVADFEASLDGATGAVRDGINSQHADAVGTAVSSLSPLIEKMLMSAMEVERNCEERSDEELGRLESLVDQILSYKKSRRGEGEAPAEKPGSPKLQSEAEGDREHSGPVQIITRRAGGGSNATAPWRSGTPGEE